MSVNVRIVAAIMKKDLQDLLPLVLLACAVFVVQPVIANLDLENEARFWFLLQLGFYWLGFFLAMLLMISVVQLDPAASLNHDWLARPIPRLDWLLAKLVFLLLTVCLPIVAARFVVNLGTYGVGGALAHAATFEFPQAWLAMPILFAIALLTPTLKRTILVLVVIAMLFMIPAWDGGRVLLSRIGIDISASTELGSMMWVQALPIVAAGVGAALVVYWLMYCRRRQARAWVALGVGFALVFVCIFPPAFVYGWDDAIAIHEAMINEADDSLDDDVVLEHALACFPAAPMAGDAVQRAANPVLVQAAWDEPFVAADPGAVTFATTVSSRDTLREWFSPSNLSWAVPVDWRIHRIRARARFVADSLPNGVELRRSENAASRQSSLSPSGTDYWMIPGRAVHALAHDPTTRLVLDYGLALLKPTAHELPTDGQRRELPGLGTCRAEIDASANAIEIECTKQGARPALVSAELVGVGSSRVDSYFRPAYTPDWLEAIGRGRYELTLRFPSLVDSSVIMMTAYEVERILHKRLETEGVLGGPLSICPLPASDEDALVESSTWSDKSPHEVSSIAVERGVRIEVLDWRRGEQAGKPVLFLIPGLGATAHSYDDIAPKLAEKYAVVGMTRRGIGGSSRPDHGYDIARLSQDVIQVLDTVGIESPILVGASIGGEELNYLGTHYAERFAGLVYLDAAYDRVTNRGPVPVPEVLLPGRPPPRPTDLVSYEALIEYYERTTRGVRPMPEGELMAMYDFAAGAFVPKFDLLFLDAIEMGLKAPDYASIPLPALAIYAMPTSSESLMEPWYDRNDPVVRHAVEAAFEWQVRVKQAEIARFDAQVADSEVLVLEDAQHWVVGSNEGEVIKAIEGLVQRL